MYIAHRIIVSHFSAYLGNKSCHERYNRRIVAKLPNEHDNLFHLHFIVRIFPQDIVDETGRARGRERELENKEARNVQRVYTKIRGVLVSAATALYTVTPNAHRARIFRQLSVSYSSIFISTVFPHTIHLPIFKGLVLGVLLLLGSFLSGSTHTID
jgi:hypothetical protein